MTHPLIKGFNRLVSILSTLIVSLIPVFTYCPPCPFCMPKYALLMAFLGISWQKIVTYYPLLALLSTLFLTIRLFSQGPIGYGHRYPFYLAAGATLLLASGTYYSLPLLNYSSVICLFIAIIWDSLALHARRNA